MGAAMTRRSFPTDASPTTRSRRVKVHRPRIAKDHIGPLSSSTRWDRNAPRAADRRPEHRTSLATVTICSPGRSTIAIRTHLAGSSRRGQSETAARHPPSERSPPTARRRTGSERDPTGSPAVERRVDPAEHVAKDGACRGGRRDGSVVMGSLVGEAPRSLQREHLCRHRARRRRVERSTRRQTSGRLSREGEASLDGSASSGHDVSASPGPAATLRSDAGAHVCWGEARDGPRHVCGLSFRRARADQQAKEDGRAALRAAARRQSEIP